MAFSSYFEQGFFPGACASTETVNTIMQFGVVCMDVTTPGGFVRPDNGNAGPVAGVNVSTGFDTSGNSGQIDVQPTNQMRIAADRVDRVVVAAGITVAVGDKLYVTASSAGAVTNVSTSAKFVGYALEASLAGTADVITARISAMRGV